MTRAGAGGWVCGCATGLLEDERFNCPWITAEEHDAMLAEIKVEHEVETRKPEIKAKPPTQKVYLIPVVKEQDVASTLPELPLPADLKRSLGLPGVGTVIKGAVELTMLAREVDETLRKYPDRVGVDGVEWVASPFYQLVFGYECPRETLVKTVNDSFAAVCKTIPARTVAWCLQLDATTGTFAVAVTTELGVRQLEREQEQGGVLLNVQRHPFRASLSFNMLPSLELCGVPINIKTTDEFTECLGAKRMAQFGIVAVKQLSNRRLVKVARIEMESDEKRDNLMDLSTLSAGGPGTGVLNPKT